MGSPISLTKLLKGLPCDPTLLLGFIWILVVGLSFFLVQREEFTPVISGKAPAFFPLNSGISRDSSRYTLVIFLHPHCPCSRATLNELSTMAAAIRSRTSIELVFTIPKGVPENWEKGSLWDYASKMPGVNVIRDPGGREAQRFGVVGSGHSLLFAPSGELRFSGGITISRGHDGNNPGSSAIQSLVQTGYAAIDHTPVFGCSLL